TGRNSRPSDAGRLDCRLHLSARETAWGGLGVARGRTAHCWHIAGRCSDARRLGCSNAGARCDRRVRCNADFAKIHRGDLRPSNMFPPPPAHVPPAAMATIDLLRKWLASKLSAEAMQWLDAEIARQCDAVNERLLVMAIGLVGRRFGRADMRLSVEDLAA